MGFFLDEQSPVIWRGPIVMGIVRQFLHDVEWAPLEFLVIDLPPGTGDAVLTLVQQVPLAGGVIVTTPQDVALLDVARGIAMFGAGEHAGAGRGREHGRVRLPGLRDRGAVFGAGGAEHLAAHFEVPLLAQIPLDPRCARAGIAGGRSWWPIPSHPASEHVPGARRARRGRGTEPRRARRSVGVSP